MTTPTPSTVSWHHGLFMHMPSMNSLEVLEETLIGVDGLGNITSIISSQHADYQPTLQQARQDDTVHQMSSRQLMIPGLTDLHVHAPQWPQLGMALQLPLQDWLERYTFPLEARYHDLEFARQVYASLVQTLLANGTTTAMYFATIHEEATELLASICLNLGQRAFVGRVAMDDVGQCPDYYRDADAQASINASERSIKAIRGLSGNDSSLVKPVITPRFIPSCTNELLTGLGELASEHHCHVQTHCSESDWEHHYVLQRLGVSDTQALADFGLLTRHTVLAHSNFISDSDMSLIQESGGGIAHCPLSNSYFATAFSLCAEHWKNPCGSVWARTSRAVTAHRCSTAANRPSLYRDCWKRAWTRVFPLSSEVSAAPVSISLKPFIWPQLAVLTCWTVRQVPSR